MNKILRRDAYLIQFGNLRRILCNRSSTNILIYFILAVLFTVEVLIYSLNTYSWHPIQCKVKSQCTRVLLVADPQLIGLQNEQLHVLTPFTIWDSDRYLSKTFSRAFQFAKPDVVIFLGDLFDEGSEATDYEFKEDLRRLKGIFLESPYESLKHIWLPGDNDIGGEYNDRITKHKVERFERMFSQPDMATIKQVKFFKINRLTSTIPKALKHDSFENLEYVVVGLSHVPLLMHPAVFVDKILDKLHPHLLFTAHMHRSAIVTTDMEFRKDRLITPVQPDANHVFDYYLGVSNIYEIIVPTCSYRMGTNKMGYGLAVIEDGAVQYTVLWSPSRFPQLTLYAILFSFALIYLVCKHLCKCKKNNTKQYERLSRVT